MKGGKENKKKGVEIGKGKEETAPILVTQRRQRAFAW